MQAAAFLAFVCLTLSPAAAAPPKTHSQMVHDVVDRYVVPGFVRLRASTQTLASETTALCASPSDAGPLQKTKSAFQTVVSDWAGVEFLRFGPLGEGGRGERFAFWPDTRGILFRQLPPLLAKREAALLAPGQLRKQSAAVQGLHAFEYILTDEKKPITAEDDDGRYRCSFAAAIAANLTDIAYELVTAWEAPDGWRHRMYVPGSDNPVYPEPADAARDFVRALLTGLQLVQERQIQPRRDTLLGSTKSPRLPFERSQLGIVYLEAGVKGLSAFNSAFGLAGHAPADKAWMTGWELRAFDLLMRDAPGVPLKPAVGTRVDENDATLRLVRQMRFHLNGLRHMIGRELAPAAELSIGFNELDGD